MPLLDKNSPIPLYHQLKEALTKLIQDEYQPGDTIPTEPELEKMFGVSRMTVRQAVNALVEEEIVSKQQGRGTYVQMPKITHQLTGVTSWTKQMRERGLEPKTVSMEMDRITPSARLQQTMNIGEEEPLIRITRVRYAGDEPMCVMVNYILEKAVPGMLEKKKNFESLYEFLREEYGIVIHKAQETVQARQVPDDEAEKLQIQAGSPVLYVTRLSYLDGGQVFEVVNLTSRADRYQYTVMLTDQ